MYYASTGKKVYISRKTLRLLQAEFPEFVNSGAVRLKDITSLQLISAMPQNVHESETATASAK